MSTVAIIPARGGSKGLPRKNLQPLGGVPLVGWAVRAALAAESVDAVYVSTDSTEISKVAAAYGAEVIMRPAELAADEALTMPVIDHALSTLATQPDLVVVMQCTSPLTTGQDVDWAIELLGDNEAVISVEEDYGLILARNGDQLTYPIDASRRRQNREPRYRLNGAVSVFRTPIRTSPPEHPVLYVMPRERSVDIDDAIDLHMAEVLLRLQNAWIVCGAGPDAREMLAIARTRAPHAITITTNSGIHLFPPPNVPDFYFLTDARACVMYNKASRDAQAAGTRLVTLRRDMQAVKQRNLEHFDEFIPITGGHNQFTRHGLTAALSGLLSLQYAMMRGAKQVHLVGMNGYKGNGSGDYYNKDIPINTGRRQKMHTENTIAPMMTEMIEQCPDVEFIFYGKINYPAAGKNVRRVLQ
jgi:CMP-N,N'-diacetyllegionaminic acid synthase